MLTAFHPARERPGRRSIPKSYRRSGVASFESRDCLLLRVVHLKYCGQLRDGQYVAQSLAETSQLDVRALGARRRIDSHQRSQAAAVDVCDPAQIQHDALGGLQQFLQTLAE